MGCILLTFEKRALSGNMNKAILTYYDRNPPPSTGTLAQTQTSTHNYTHNFTSTLLSIAKECIPSKTVTLRPSEPTMFDIKH